jgi:uncharacterized protein (TIGR03083 family)
VPDLITVLCGSHDRLVALVEPLTDEQLTGRAYPSDWSVAQVLSHLGSSAEIFTRYLEAGLAGEETPGREVFSAIWDAWNAKEPPEQARDAVKADRLLVERLEGLDPTHRAEFRATLFAGEVDVDGLAQLRINEHALHSWDIAVVLDPAATVAPDAVEVVVDHLDRIVGWTAKPRESGDVVHVVTTSPAREFSLSLVDPVTLDPTVTTPGTARLEIPAEAFVRLVYGRLDPDHTPELSVTGLDLDDLRRVFPGP